MTLITKKQKLMKWQKIIANLITIGGNEKERENALPALD